MSKLLMQQMSDGKNIQLEIARYKDLGIWIFRVARDGAF